MKMKVTEICESLQFDLVLLLMCCCCCVNKICEFDFKGYCEEEAETGR